MPNERFTELPQAASANMSDIICAVQSFVSPSNLGESVQETLQQVFNLFQSNVILFNAGNPNGSVAGTTFQLCWDTVNSILYVCTATGTALTAVWTKSITLTAGTGITISQAGNNITISASASGVTWNTITAASANMSPNNGYTSNNAGTVVLTLPNTSSVGDVIYVNGLGAGGWSIAQLAGQQIIDGSSLSTIGVGGSVSSTNRYDSVKLVCLVANLTWALSGGSQGILTVV